MKNLVYLTLLIQLFLVACSTVKNTVTIPISNNAAYQNAIEEAMSPAPSKIDSNLIPINFENKNLIWKNIEGEEYLLVVSWKQDITYYEPFVDSSFYNTGSYPIWITTAPELINRMKTEQYIDVNLRLKQLIGLPPTSEYSYFVEFWVKPSDLFRPCPDMEINDSSCQLCFPETTDSSHIIWINEYRINSYYPCELFDKYPWSQLGYTYDWNPENKTHVGLSEFVIKQNTNIGVNAIYTTEEYLSKSF